MITVAVEIGGTFTDLIMTQDGEIVRTAKVLSTPGHPEKGALNALDQLDLPLEVIETLVHGSTVATNAVLERKGARTILLVSEGYRDVLEIQREERSDVYDLHFQKPQPLVSRELVLPVRERVGVDGEIVIPLDDLYLTKTIENENLGHVEAVAICLLHAYKYTAHEERVRDLVAQILSVENITLSSRILPEFREYERASTTVLNAYVAPIMKRYIENMYVGLKSRGFKGNFRIVQSNGGVLPARHISDQSVNTLLSGPAAGVIGATRSAENAGIRNTISFDMGGTSTDVCLVTDAKPHITTESKLDGLPIRVPMIDIVTTGAGGGSIARVEAGRLLRVGPQSAGADPGPACYGKGGQEATVTDANVLLGLIRPKIFFGGKMTLSVDKSEAAVKPLARILGLSVPEAAESIVKVADVTMAQAIRLVSVERGHDPRDYALLAFGGAGPLHAVAMAEELDIQKVLIPVNPGLLSAFGLLVADFKRNYVRTLVQPGRDLTREQMNWQFTALEKQAIKDLTEYQIPIENRRLRYSVDMRYLGQAFELNVPLELDLLDKGVERVTTAFHKVHEVRYGHSSEKDEVELVNYRLDVAVAQQDIHVHTSISAAGGPKADTDRIFIGGQWQECLFYSRSSLPSGFQLIGPSVVEEDSSTTLIPPGWQAQIDVAGNIYIRKGGIK
jgi:N-methylhydantoinase A